MWHQIGQHKVDKPRLECFERVWAIEDCLREGALLLQLPDGFLDETFAPLVKRTVGVFHLFGDPTQMLEASGAVAVGQWQWGSGSGAVAVGRLQWGGCSGAVPVGQWQWGSGSGAVAVGQWQWGSGSGAVAVWQS